MSERDPILAGDCRFVLPEAFVADVMVVDPPYRDHVHKNTTSQDQANGGGVRHNDLGFACMTPELMTWLCQMAARTRRWSIIYTDIESVAAWKEGLELAGATYIRTLPWVRWSIPQLSGDRPPQGFECLVVAHGSAKGRKHWNGAGNLTHLAHLAMRGAEKHKTQKPLDQLLDLVSWFSDRGVLDQGELVLDPCAGSGTTGLACKILGRRFIGCELDAEWVEKGNARIRACNLGDLPGSLSSRDAERFLRWSISSEKEKADAVSRKENTERVRKRLEDKRLSLVPTQMSDETPGQPYSAERPVAPPGDPTGGLLAQDGELSDEALALIFDRRQVGEETVMMTNEQIEAMEAMEANARLSEEPENMNKEHLWTEAYQRCLAEIQTETDIALALQAGAHLRPPSGGGRTDGVGAPEPAAPSVATARPPKPSAAARTVPLFEETYPTKPSWEEAYRRVLVELAPPLSPALLAKIAEKRKTAAPVTATSTPVTASTAVTTSAPVTTTTPGTTSTPAERAGVAPSVTTSIPAIRVTTSAVAAPSTSVTTTSVSPDDIDIALLAASPAQIESAMLEQTLDVALAAIPNGTGATMQALAGTIPAHVLAELGMHPSLVDEPVRNRALVVARHTGWPDDWNVLQIQAPTGFFTRVLKEMQVAPGERLAVLAEAAQARGLRVGVFDVAGWSFVQREAARACIAQNADWPEFFEKYTGDQAGIIGSCAACGRGDERPFMHTCEKGLALGDTKRSEVVTPAPPPAPVASDASATATEKRGRGRPPGVKNKAPKEWKAAYARVVAELAPVS